MTSGSLPSSSPQAEPEGDFSLVLLTMISVEELFKQLLKIVF
jgi:hypothetical protein